MHDRAVRKTPSKNRTVESATEAPRIGVTRGVSYRLGKGLFVDLLRHHAARHGWGAQESNLCMLDVGRIKNSPSSRRGSPSAAKLLA